MMNGPKNEGDPMITKRSLPAGIHGGLAAMFPDAVRTASAETAPRMLVGFGAGGAIDVIVRLLVEGRTTHRHLLLTIVPAPADVSRSACLKAA
jgi:hypothetical protein